MPVLSTVEGLILAAALLLSGCEAGLDMVPICRPEVMEELHSEDWPIPNWGASYADLYLQFSEPVALNLAGADELTSGDAELLSQLTWRCNTTCLDPSVQLAVDGDKASLTIVQGSLLRSLPEDTALQNEWDFTVTRAISYSLVLNAGALNGTLDLTDLPLTALKVSSGDAEAAIAFPNRNPQKLRLFEVQTANSNLSMRGLGNANFEKLTLRGGGGNYDLRFGGNWPRSAEAQIELGKSNVEIFVPDKVGLRVEIQGDASPLNMGNLQEETENLYLSDGFAEAETTLVIRIRMAGGSLTVRWGRGD